MIYILDTDTFSDATRRRRRLRERIDRERHTHRVLTTVITELEMYHGWHERVTKAADRVELSRAIAGLNVSKEFLAEFEVLPFDEIAAEHFERLKREKLSRKAGRKDLLIGCVALAHSARVVTRNLKDFRLIPGLDAEDWSE